MPVAPRSATPRTRRAHPRATLRTVRLSDLAQENVGGRTVLLGFVLEDIAVAAGVTMHAIRHAARTRFDAYDLESIIDYVISTRERAKRLAERDE